MIRQFFEKIGLVKHKPASNIGDLGKIMELMEYDQARQFLRQKFGGKKPSDHNIKIRLREIEAIRARINNWIAHRNEVFKTAEMLRKQLKIEEALSLYLEVFYLDLNGFNIFSIQSGLVVDGVPSAIKRITDTLAISRQQLNVRFMEIGTRVATTPLFKDIFTDYAMLAISPIWLPKTPESCWQVLEKREVYKTDQPFKQWSFEERKRSTLEIFISNLAQWKTCGVVNTLKIYTAPLDNVCEFCREMEGKVIDITDAEIGITIPPFKCCQNTNTLGCRCRFRPCDMKPIITQVP